MNGYVTLSLLDLGIGLGLVLVAAGLAAFRRFPLVRNLLIGTVRAALQLALMGFALTVIFDLDEPAPLMAVLVLMCIYGGWEASRRAERPIPRSVLVATVSIMAGSFFVILYAQLLVVNIEPWFAPRYLIPLAGITIAYAMNAVNLLLDRFTLELQSRRDEIEARLCLGASPREAVASASEASLRTAWTPILNHLVVVGIVQIPGMMTGQIIAGASPLEAVRYQVLICFMLSTVVVISTFCAESLAFRQVFNQRAQLRVPGVKKINS